MAMRLAKALVIVIMATLNPRVAMSAPDVPAAQALIAETAIAIGALDAVLAMPAGVIRPPVAVLFAGSGPTDRNGNGPSIKPATLKKLSDALTAQGIATLRYDKRAAPTWKPAFGKIEDFRFPHFVDDAERVIADLRARDAFARIVLIGHSEGALVATLAAQRAPVDGLVLLTGTSRRQGDLLKEQVQRQSTPEVYQMVAGIVDRIMAGEIVHDAPPALQMPPVAQPGLASAFNVDPVTPLKGLTLPVMIVGGGKDLQVPRLDFDALGKAAPHAQMLWLESMNHVLNDVTDLPDNRAAYNQPDRALNTELVTALGAFVLGIAAR